MAFLLPLIWLVHLGLLFLSDQVMLKELQCNKDKSFNLGRKLKKQHLISICNAFYCPTFPIVENCT